MAVCILRLFGDSPAAIPFGGQRGLESFGIYNALEHGVSLEIPEPQSVQGLPSTLAGHSKPLFVLRGRYLGPDRLPVEKGQGARIGKISCLFMGRQVGTVVELLDPGVFEVEFTDNDGRTFASLALKENQLLLLHYQPLEAA